MVERSEEKSNSWRTIASASTGPKGGIVALKEHINWNAGDLLLVFPGMEGSGESCIEIVLAVLESLRIPQRLVLVDYSQECCDEFDELVDIIRDLIQRPSLNGILNARIWAQSFGNLLALSVLGRDQPQVQNFVSVSPFTQLPSWKLLPAVLTLKFTPTWAYRLSIGPIGRLVFGPVGDRPDHPFFEAMKRADAPTMMRRMSWLQNRSFAVQFEKNRRPTHIYIGLADRLIALRQQRSFFEKLRDGRETYRISDIPTSGHVIIPTETARNAVRKIVNNWFETDLPIH
ncbi:alpha/beta fold hydrolase domain-containing protein [Bradyrhizobium barranii]